MPRFYTSTLETSRRLDAPITRNTWQQLYPNNGKIFGSEEEHQRDSREKHFDIQHLINNRNAGAVEAQSMAMHLLVSLTSPASGVDQVDQGSLGLLPATGLKTTIGVDEEKVGSKDLQHSSDTILDFLLGGNTRRVDIVNTRTDLVGVTVLLEGLQELHVTLRGLDGDDISVKSLDRGEDVVEVGVAEVGVGLESIGDTGSGDLEGGESPGEVGIPVGLAERKTLTESRLVNLDSLDATLLEINDLVTESESELLALNLTRDIGTREGPVEDGDGSSKHTLHGLLGNALGVLRPLNGDGAGTADIGGDDGGTDVTRTVALYPTVLGESETVELFTEVLNHVVTLGFTVDEQVQADVLLGTDDALNLLLDEVVVLLLSDLLLVELSTSSTDLLSLLETKTSKLEI